MNRRMLLCVVALGALVFAALLFFGGAAPVSAEGPDSTVARSISGVVWQDYCVTDCTAGSGLRRGNGVPNEAEKRLAGVQVGLAYGICRGSHVFRYTTTDSQGRYLFTSLGAGTYCVTVNSRQSNTAFPKPGVWTRPSGRSPWYIASYTVFGPWSRSGLNFGWDKVP